MLTNALCFICVQLLIQFPQVQLSEVYQLIHTHLESMGGIKGHEERGIYFGRVFALLALLRSGRLTTDVSLLDTNILNTKASAFSLHVVIFMLFSIGLGNETNKNSCRYTIHSVFLFSSLWGEPDMLQAWGGHQGPKRIG